MSESKIERGKPEEESTATTFQPLVSDPDACLHPSKENPLAVESFTKAVSDRASARSFPIEYDGTQYALKVSNTVNSGRFSKKVHLPTVATVVKGSCEYSIFPSAASVMRKPSCTAQIFESSLIIPGPKNTIDALICAYQVLNQISDSLGIHETLINFKPYNVVASFALGYPLDLDLFLQDHELRRDGHARYTPDGFPGLFYHILTEPKIVFILYQTGKVVAIGTRNREDLQKRVNELYPILPLYYAKRPYRQISASQRKNRPMIKKVGKENSKKVKNLKKLAETVVRELEQEPTEKTKKGK